MLDLSINVHSLYLLTRIRFYKHKCCQTSKYSKFPLLTNSHLISGSNSPLFCSHFSIIFKGAFTIFLHKKSSRKHSVPSCPCLLVPCCAFSCLVVSSRVLLCLLVSSRATVLQDFVQILESFSSKCEIF